MIYTAITAETWTKVSDPTTDILVVKPQFPTTFQFSFGEPNAGESGFSATEVVLNTGCTEELWVYCTGSTTMIVGTP
tara:strand:+ start:211 stop:441 length:231 start_codon:yes stop_codon:yes gene_type:complete